MQRFGEIANSVRPAAVDVSFCGPKGLLNQVRARMRENKILDTNLQYKYFGFR